MRKIITAPTTCEAILHESGLSPIAGIDEAGRGSLAGPVVACALILPPGLVIEGVNDSKKLTPGHRAILAQRIKSVAVSYSYGILDATVIDKINIHNATLRAMTMAVEGLTLPPKTVLADGKFPPYVPCPTLHIIKGDVLSHLIAAAGILAKTARDKIMQDLHIIYPRYGFNKHKGYGTVAHREAIKQYGPCKLHRTSYKLI